MSKNRIARALATGLLSLIIAMPSVALANDVDRANSAIAVAQSKIQTGDSLGVTARAADIQARARTALQTARDEQTKHHQIQAIHAAENSDALADLAIASAELKALTAQRDQLAAN